MIVTTTHNMPCGRLWEMIQSSDTENTVKETLQYVKINREIDAKTRNDMVDSLMFRLIEIMSA